MPRVSLSLAALLEHGLPISSGHRRLRSVETKRFPGSGHLLYWVPPAFCLTPQNLSVERGREPQTQGGGRVLCLAPYVWGSQPIPLAKAAESPDVFGETPIWRRDGMSPPTLPSVGQSWAGERQSWRPPSVREKTRAALALCCSPSPRVPRQLAFPSHLSPFSFLVSHQLRGAAAARRGGARGPRLGHPAQAGTPSHCLYQDGSQSVLPSPNHHLDC